MNRNRKKAVAASVAVGMTVVMGASPILAADTDISKEETVYVNAAADGTPEERAAVCRKNFRSLLCRTVVFMFLPIFWNLV